MNAKHVRSAELTSFANHKSKIKKHLANLGMESSKRNCLLFAVAGGWHELVEKTLTELDYALFVLAGLGSVGTVVTRKMSKVTDGLEKKQQHEEERLKKGRPATIHVLCKGEGGLTTRGVVEPTVLRRRGDAEIILVLEKTERKRSDRSGRRATENSPLGEENGYICCMQHIQGGDRNQTLLLPAAVDDYVGPENPVRFIEAFVDQSDLQEAGFRRVQPKGTGRPVLRIC